MFLTVCSIVGVVVAGGAASAPGGGAHHLSAAGAVQASTSGVTAWSAPPRVLAAADPDRPAGPPTPVGPSAGAQSAPGTAPAPAPVDDSSAGTASPGHVPGFSARPVALPDFPRPPADPAQRRLWLKAVLDETFALPTLAKSKIGVMVVESDTGKPVYARGEKTALNAASNVKLITSSAALALLGPDYRWKTTLSAAAGPRGLALGPGGEVAGDLFLRGFGDPTLDTQDLNAMATDVAAAGIRRVRGAIVADESFFDGTHVGPAYDQKSDSTASRAPSAGLSVNGNVVDVTIVPAGKSGGAARVLTDPPAAAFVISGRIVTAATGPAVTTVETRESDDGRTQIAVSGRVRLGSEPRTYRRRVVSPPLVAATTLKTLLERRGITVGGSARIGVTPAQGLRIVSNHDSAPLAVVVHELNKRSNNFTAEQLLRTLGAEMGGRPGTWDKGLEAVARYLGALGIRKGSYQMSNGSGLYDSNRFSPEQITLVLRGAMRDFRIAAELMSSLAIAGTDGTIGHRMANTPAERFVRAKTGTLANTSCLSGFAGSPGKAPLIFSILMNDVPGPADARRAQDRAAELLIRYIEADAKP